MTEPLKECVDCRAATTRDRCRRCERDLELATPFAFVSPLEEPSFAHACPRCKNAYAVEVGEQCYGCDRAEEKARAHAAALERAGLVGWHAEVHYDHPDVLALFAASDGQVLRNRVRKVMHTRTRAPTITITGATGAGKSTLGALIAKERLSSALFVRTTSLIGAIDDHGLGEGTAPLLARAKAARVLLLDELMVPAVPSRREKVEDLIWGRVDAGLLTIITHGFREDEIGRDWGAGMHRRLYADGQHVHLPCPACGHEVHRGQCESRGCKCARRAGRTSS